MKRKQFKVTGSDGQTAVRYAWNAARDQGRAFVRAQGIPGTWSQVESTVHRNTGGNLALGYFTYRHDDTGVTYSFTVERIA